MAFSLPSTDLLFLSRVDAAWRTGKPQAIIAAELDQATTPNLHQKLNRLGFKFKRDESGARLVTILGEMSFQELLSSGELRAAEEVAA